MDVLLLTLTIFSLAAAGSFGLVTWYTLRDARLRSEARVASLAAAIDGSDERPAGEQRDPALFDAPRRAAAQGRPVLKLAIAFAISVLVIIVIAMTAVDRGSVPATATDAGTSAAPSLELLSMRHDQAVDRLTVTGLVRNPGAPPATSIIAVVFAFDRDGNFLASGRAPLDYRRLDGGDESPFRVTVPNVDAVGRYRVSFRTEAGVVRHVDRRIARAPLAAARR